MSDSNNVILCVDDDPDILDFYETILGAEGYDVTVAPSAEDGVRAFKDVAPDVVFVDLMMEEIDAGANFVKEVRALQSDVPIYMVTSVGDGLNTTLDCSQLGLNGVVQKPIDIANLRNIVKTALAG